MSYIALYNALTKLGLEHDAAKEAVADVVNSKKVATKSDIKNMATKTDIAELKGDTWETRAELKYVLVGSDSGRHCCWNNQIFIKRWQRSRSRAIT